MAMGEFFTELLPTVGKMHTSMIDFDASGRMAFLTGPFYYEVPRSSGSPERVEGTHMTIFVRKGRDWKIRSQIFRTEVSAPGVPGS
ncbi:MAG: ketosteroid isomerase-like protein [Myxococcota bacterium]